MMITATTKMQYENFKHFVYDDPMVKVIYTCTVVAFTIV